MLMKSSMAAVYTICMLMQLLLRHEDTLKPGIVQVCVTHVDYVDKFNCMRNTPSADGHGNIQRIKISIP
jgi:hypothetical protein